MAEIVLCDLCDKEIGEIRYALDLYEVDNIENPGFDLDLCNKCKPTIFAAILKVLEAKK